MFWNTKNAWNNSKFLKSQKIESKEGRKLNLGKENYIHSENFKCNQMPKTAATTDRPKIGKPKPMIESINI